MVWDPRKVLSNTLIVGDTKLTITPDQVNDWYIHKLIYPCEECDGYHIQEDR